MWCVRGLCWGFLVGVHDSPAPASQLYLWCGWFVGCTGTCVCMCVCVWLRGVGLGVNMCM